MSAFIFMPSPPPFAEGGNENSQADLRKLPSDEGEDIEEVMRVLEEKERELLRREDALRKEEERLNMLENTLEMFLREYSALREKLKKELAASADKSSQPGEWITRAAKIYESMPPEEAAQRIEKMDSDMAVDILSKIKSKQAGKILAAISADKAVLLTEKIVEKKGDK